MQNQPPKTGISLTDKQKTHVSIQDTPAETGQQRGDLMFQMGSLNKPIATIENMRKLLDFFGINCRYNIISKQYELVIPGEEFSTDNTDVAALARIASRMKETGLPTDHYKDYLAYIGDSNQYNPVLQWVTSKSWDGTDRLPELYATVVSKNEEAKRLFIRRWMITAMYMAMKDGFDSPGCLVFQGPQGLGKTWWFRKLCPVPNLIRTDASVDTRNRDSISQIIRYWIVELGELGSTFRKSDIDGLKAFITSNSDILRRPYGSSDQTYPRRTALAASVNEFTFLHDTTGNRRYFTVQCTSINSYHNIDMQQVWAQIHRLIQDGETPFLTAEERNMVDLVNSEHMQIDPVEEMIRTHYEWGNDYGCQWRTSTQVALEIGIRMPTQKDTRTITDVVRKLNNNSDKKYKRDAKGRMHLMPPRR